MDLPSLPEIIDSIPIVLSLVLIEGLLSVDNSLAIAAMASRLPEAQRPRALNWGMAGAYGFRCLCLLFASIIIQYRWLTLLGAAYLIYLMCKELTAEKEEEDSDAEDDKDPAAALAPPHQPERSFVSVVIGILFLDASLSVDNVVAAIAMTPKLWAVYVGVGIGILSLRFLAGYCMKLIEKFPILEKTAFMLVGFVGVLLVVEVFGDVHLGPFGKFVIILGIVAASIAYERFEALRRPLKPLVIAVHHVMRVIAMAFGVLFWPLTKAVEVVTGLFHN